MSEFKGRKKALIISISDYNDKSLPKLDFCKNDGEEMYRVLTNKKVGFEIPDSRKIIGKTNKKTMEDQIINFFRKNVVEDDTLLFYFSGHGVLDGYGGRFFANTEVNCEIPEQNGVRFEMLNEQMMKTRAERKIAILDCCFSGGAIPDIAGKSEDDKEKEAENLGSESLHKVFGKSRGSCVLASSLSNKRSYSLLDKSYSAFTHFIIKGLKGVKDSVDENGFVTPEKLSKYTFRELDKIPELHNQKPVRNVSISGEIILAEYPEFVSPAKMKEEKLESEIVKDMLDKMSLEQLELYRNSIDEKIAEKKQILAEKKQILEFNGNEDNTKKIPQTNEKEKTSGDVKIEEKFVIVNNHKIRYLETGKESKEYLILLHGLGYSADQWKNVMPYLNKKYHVIAPDLLGFGYSDKPLEDYDMATFSRFFTAFTQVLRIEHAAVIGSDLGGRIAAECAIKQIKSIQKIILVSPFGSTKGYSTEAMDAYVMAAMYPQEESAINAFKMMANPNKEIDKKEVIDFVKRMQFPNAKLAFMSTLLSSGKNAEPLVSHTSKISIPTAVIWGTLNTINHISNGEKLASSIPNCQFTKMDNCANNPFNEEPKEFSDIVLDFLE